jgi:hypothetical protein
MICCTTVAIFNVSLLVEMGGCTDRPVFEFPIVADDPESNCRAYDIPARTAEKTPFFCCSEIVPFMSVGVPT